MRFLNHVSPRRLTGEVHSPLSETDSRHVGHQHDEGDPSLRPVGVEAGSAASRPSRGIDGNGSGCCRSCQGTAGSGGADSLRLRIERAYCEANRQSEPLDCPPVCYVYAPVGDYESASFPPDDDGTEPNAPSSFYQTVRERTTSSGYVASDLEPLPVFASNTATARLVLAMPFILGFLVAAILVAGYVFTW